jgi:hypothetical protein
VCVNILMYRVMLCRALHTDRAQEINISGSILIILSVPVMRFKRVDVKLITIFVN